MSELSTKVLNTVLRSKKNIESFSKVLSKVSPDELYESLGTILSKDINTKDAFQQIKGGKIMWDHPRFNDVKKRIRERQEFLINPFEVEEGVLECPKCYGKKTFSYSQQTRGGDEATSTFSQCMKCMNKWVYNG